VPTWQAVLAGTLRENINPVSDSKKIPNAAGTRGFWKVLRSALHTPSAVEADRDLQGLARGESRRVSCFLRSNGGARFRQGYLDVGPSSAMWHPFWSVKRPALLVRGPISETAPPTGNDWQIKQGGLNEQGASGAPEAGWYGLLQ
jgi:hypothetical protein